MMMNKTATIADNSRPCNEHCDDLACPKNAGGVCRAPNQCLGYEEAGKVLAELEAAKRELAKFSACGDSAKMHEALVKIYHEVRSYCFDYGAGESHKSLVDRIMDDPPDYTSYQDSILEIDRIVEAALSAPPRNCDRFSAWEEANMAFEKENAHRIGFMNLYTDVLKWLFAPATKQEGGVK